MIGVKEEVVSLLLGSTIQMPPRCGRGDVPHLHDVSKSKSKAMGPRHAICIGVVLNIVYEVDYNWTCSCIVFRYDMESCLTRTFVF